MTIKKIIKLVSQKGSYSCPFIVKKILFILSLFLLTSSAVYSAEEVILEKEGFMQNLIAITEPTITQADIKLETGAVTNYPLTNPDTFHRHFHVYDELARTVHNVYNLQIENTASPAKLTVHKQRYLSPSLTDTQRIGTPKSITFTTFPVFTSQM